MNIPDYRPTIIADILIILFCLFMYHYTNDHNTWIFIIVCFSIFSSAMWLNDILSLSKIIRSFENIEEERDKLREIYNEIQLKNKSEE